MFDNQGYLKIPVFDHQGCLIIPVFASLVTRDYSCSLQLFCYLNWFPHRCDKATDASNASVIHCNSLPPTSHTHSHSHTHSLTLAYTHTHHTHMHTTEHTFSIHDEPLYRPSKDDDDVPPLDISSDKPSWMNKHSPCPHNLPCIIVIRNSCPLW